MGKVFLVLLCIFIPVLASGAGGITVNNQPTYAVPPGSTNVLIMDLTLPENLTSIEISNLGDARQGDISGLYIFQDGPSSGWDGDEVEIFRKSSSPFWDAAISANSSQLRIFVTVDLASTAASGRTIKPQAIINSSTTVAGPERTILAGTQEPAVPLAPFAEKGEALSATAIRWNFRDLSNNEFGFRIKDSSLKTVAKIEKSDISYIDETGLKPGTCYSGRRAVAFNDRGESFSSAIFDEVCTLPSTTPTPTPTPTLTPAPTSVEEEYTGGPLSPQELRAKITEIQQKIIELLGQLIKLLQEQISRAQASLFNAFEIFTNFIESRFR